MRALGRLLHVGGRAAVRTIPTVTRAVRPVTKGVLRAWRRPTSTILRRTGGGVRALARENIRGIRTSAVAAAKRSAARLHHSGNIRRAASGVVRVAARQPGVRDL